MLWSAIYAAWLHICDVQFGRQSKDSKKFMAQWLAKLQGWGKWEESNVEERQVRRLQRAIHEWIPPKRDIEKEEEPGLRRPEEKSTKKRKKEALKQQVLEQWQVAQDPP